MNDYNDLMNEYEEVKKDISEGLNNITNSTFIIKTFQKVLELFSNQILMIQNQKDNFFLGIEKNTVEFSKQLIKEKNLIENESTFPLNNLLSSAKFVITKNLDTFNNIKVSLIQERQKLNKTKEDYFNFISSKEIKSSINGDENKFFNAKKENFFQLYKYEVNQMNTIIDENNIVYKNMYEELYNWKKIRKNKIKQYFKKFAKYFENIGNSFIDFSKNLLKTLNEEEEEDNKNQIKSKDQNNFISKPRFEKIVLEDFEKKESKNNVKEMEENKKEDYNEAGQKSKSNEIIKDELFDFDIIDEAEVNSSFKEIGEKKSGTKSEKLSKSKGLLDKIKGLKRNKKKEQKEKDLSSNKPNHSNGFDEFELIGGDLLNNENNSTEKNEKIIDDIIKKMISKDELLSQDINMLMNLLKEENPSTKKLYSYTFLI